MKVVCIVQARLGSKRFRGKVLKKLLRKELIFTLLERVRMVKSIDELVIAIPETDIKLYNILNAKGYKVFKGSEKDVLSRYYHAALKHKANIIVRITADCPLVDPELVSNVIKKFKLSNYDYISNINPPTYPDGLDVEVYSFNTLKKIFKESKLPEDREHISSYVFKNKDFKTYNFENSKDYSFLRLTVDYEDDLLMIKKIVKNFKSKNKNFLF